MTARLVDADLVALHAQGLSDRAIGDRLGMSRPAIVKARDRLQLPINYAKAAYAAKRLPVAPPGVPTERVSSMSPVRVWLRLNGFRLEHTANGRTRVDGVKYDTAAELLAFVNRVRTERGLMPFEVRE